MNGRRTFGDMAGPMLAGALLMALIWTAVELAPVAGSRWFGS